MVIKRVKKIIFPIILSITANTSGFLSNAEHMASIYYPPNYSTQNSMDTVAAISPSQTYEFINVTEPTRLHPDFIVTSGKATVSIVPSTAAPMKITLFQNNSGINTTVKSISVSSTVTQQILLENGSYFFVVSPVSSTPVSGTITVYV